MAKTDEIKYKGGHSFTFRTDGDGIIQEYIVDGERLNGIECVDIMSEMGKVPAMMLVSKYTETDYHIADKRMTTSSPRTDFPRKHLWQQGIRIPWILMKDQEKFLIKTVPDNWISVSEMLHNGNGEIYEGCLEESSLVLIYGISPDKEQAFGIGRYVIDHNNPNDSGWNGYMDGDWDLDHCNVTHWMPLPGVPKEVK